MVGRSGRRPGNQDTRAVILGVARQAFAERGYDGVSLRTIAAGAGVDPALIHHYFGTKEQLFLDAVQAPIDPRTLLPEVFSGDRDELGVRLVGTFLRVWDSPAGAAAAAMLRSAVSNDWMVRLLRDFFTRQILRRVLQHLDLDPAEAPYRANLVASQLFGLAFVRYIVRLEPLASAPADWVVAAVAPTVQRYITGELPSPPDGGTRHPRAGRARRRPTPDTEPGPGQRRG